MIAKPFLKWAGGKSQLLSQLNNLYPQILLNNQIDCYIEPFIGGGSVFFDIIQRFSVKKSIISDQNINLVLVYNLIKHQTIDLINSLKYLQHQYLSSNDINREALFYECRNEFNLLRVNNIHIFDENNLRKASLFIFLNKTGYNGLYRVNSKGLFNTPFGKYKNPKICDESNLLAVSEILKNTEIYHQDYKNISQFIDKNTFIYFDPPYRPLNQTSNFTAYSGEFNDTHQIELAEFFVDLHQNHQVHLMLSNSDTSHLDSFFEENYPKIKGFKHHFVEASRMINSKSSGRGKITEIVITNY